MAIWLWLFIVFVTVWRVCTAQIALQQQGTQVFFRTLVMVVTPAPAIAMGWDDALLSEIQAQQHDQEQTWQEVDLRESTDDEEDSIPSTPSSSFWWSEALLGAAAALDLEIPPNMHCVNILSACTGVCAEGEVMKAHAGLLIRLLIHF